jgi:hypothetical protein
MHTRYLLVKISPHSEKHGTQEFLRVALAWTQLAAGISQLIVTNKTKLPHLKVRWLSSLQTFLHDIGVKIELDKDQVPLPQ